MSGVIAVVSSKGGACKTTTAVCLAAQYDQAGARVLVVDADGPQHHATKWLRGGEDLAGIAVVTGPGSLAACLEQHVDKYDIVIVDIMGADTATLSIAAANADLVIIPTNDSPLDTDGVTHTVTRLGQIEAELASRGLPRRLPYRVLLSRVEPGTTLHRLVREEIVASGAPLLATEIRRRVIYKEAAFVGSAPCHLDDPRARDEMAALHAEIDALLTRVREIA